MRPRRVGLRQSVVLSIGSTLAYATSQWALFVILARTTNVEVVGQFSLMVAVTAPLFLFLGLNLRVAQATDATRRFRAADFINLQLIVNAACVLTGLLLLPIIGLPHAVWPAFAVYLLSKAVEAMSTNIYGLFQLFGRMDLVAASLVLRSILGPILFSLGLLVGAGLLGACIGLLMGWSAAQILDRRNAARVVRVASEDLTNFRDWSRVPHLAIRVWPLGASGGVNSLTANAPRYAVNVSLGTSELGAFTGVSYLSQIIQTVVGALGAAVVPSLSQDLAAGRIAAARHIVRRTVMVTLVVVAFALIAAWLIGPWFLGAAMGAAYADGPLLVALIAATGISGLYRCPGRALQAAHRFRTYLAIDLLVLASVALLSMVCVPRLGLMGAAVAIGAGSLLGLIVASVALRAEFARRT